jgi:cyclic beta-1,2-glucan synthetase
VLLFTPPFDHSQPNPGYIMGYPPGLRENGGQYTHGSLWFALAWARLRDGNRAAGLLQMMNPVELNRAERDVARYKGEPYVVAADISSAPGKVGQAGWTWYTGSASWMYRVWIEEVLGLRVRGNRLSIDPVIPDEWPGFDLTYRFGNSVYQISVIRDSTLTAPTLELNGQPSPERFIPLEDTGKTYEIVLRLSPHTLPESPAEPQGELTSPGATRA